MTYFQEILPDPNRDKTWILLLFIGALGSVYEPLTAIAPHYTVYIATVVIVCFYAKDVYRRVQIQRAQGLPDTSARFDPFHVPDLWNRNAEVETLSKLISASAHQHILVTGESGAGKTKLVRALLPQYYNAPKNADKKTVLICSDRYESPAKDLIHRLPGSVDAKKRLVDDITRFMEKNSCGIQDLFDPQLRDDLADKFAEADTVLNRMFDHLSKVIPSGQTTVLAFDQLERIIQIIRIDERKAQNENGFEIYFLCKIIEFLRERLPHARTLFVVRGELYYRSLDFLETDAPILIGCKPSTVTYFLCPGINSASDDDAAEGILKEFKETPTVIEIGTGLVDDFVEISRLRSRTFSNTFMVRLIGYVIVNFYHNRYVREELIRNGANQESFLKFYFQCLLNEYAKKNKRENAIECLKVIIFAIAVENRVAGRAVDIEMIAALAHLPQDVVIDAVEFLHKRGMLLSEGKAGDAAYRLAHDVICDYAIGSQQFSVDHPSWFRLKDAIRGLGEARAEKSGLTPLCSYANPIDDLVGRLLPQYPDLPTPAALSFMSKLSLVLIWVFYFYGAALVLEPRVCALTSWISLKYIWEARQCEFVSQFYVIVYVVHVLWVTFIYFVARNFLNLTMRRPFSRVVSESMAAIGAILGIVLSQSPSLFLVPIVTVGMIMGILLLVSSNDGTYVGGSADDSRRWGKRSVVNMLIATALVVVCVAIFHPLSTTYFDELAKAISHPFGTSLEIDGHAIVIGWIYAVSGTMIFFWWHVRPEQQTEISFASRLALNDWTHQEEAKRNEPISTRTPYSSLTRSHREETQGG